MNTIDFTCWEDEVPTVVGLEPEGMLFTVEGKDVLTFKATKTGVDFKWLMKLSGYNHIQLYPISVNSYSIEVFKNDNLIF